MRTTNKAGYTKGDVVVTHGSNGGVISTVIVTDDRAEGRPLDGGAECRPATAAEIAEAGDRIKHHY